MGKISNFKVFMGILTIYKVWMGTLKITLIYLSSVFHSEQNITPPLYKCKYNHPFLFHIFQTSTFIFNYINFSLLETFPSKFLNSMFIYKINDVAII